MKTKTTQGIQLNSNQQESAPKHFFYSYITILILPLCISCQSLSSFQRSEVTNVITHQGQLLEAIVAERQHETFRAELKRSRTLWESELRMMSAMTMLIDSNNRLKEAFRP